MYTAIVVASICPFESLMAAICGSVVVHLDRVGMHMALLRLIHSLRGRQGMMYGKTVIWNQVSEQTWQGMTRILGPGLRHTTGQKACNHTLRGAPNHAPVRIRRHQGEWGRKVPAGQQLTHTHP